MATMCVREIPYDSATVQVSLNLSANNQEGKFAAAISFQPWLTDKGRPVKRFRPSLETRVVLGHRVWFSLAVVVDGRSKDLVEQTPRVAHGA